ncbi:SDR family NAD(P)-dependent oxidoreductase [Novosphingobium sp. BL-52-GroH]|uniref:SDR family NAD(P)-dependent oxidoreductase n=1 Tax=Novosphingobium sp. BL-52-GroH TaxID=3349877 RepID=UPI00384A7049
MTFAGRFTDRCAVITGGASGVGLDVARRIVAEGGRVALWDCNEATLAATGALLPDAVLVPVDVTDWSAVAAAAQTTFDAFGRIDVLVAGAGITGPNETVADYPVKDWALVNNVNLIGIFHSCRAVVPFMQRADYGRIVTISSVAGKEGNPKASAYSAAKAGVIALTKSLGKELATTGIRANTVTPAVFRTPLLDQMGQEFKDYMLSKIPMGRFGESEEIAALICWLCSEEASFSTAAVFDASGGRSTY